MKGSKEQFEDNETDKVIDSCAEKLGNCAEMFQEMAEMIGNICEETKNGENE
ncbi:unnamed protein product [marine sediment metagenome]|uniref:Uncharacterized protein n=1 Tax=marine sediment metagenome TaxID=412755 RepID=X0YV69_9ZZZZ